MTNKQRILDIIDTYEGGDMTEVEWQVIHTKLDIIKRIIESL